MKKVIKFQLFIILILMPIVIIFASPISFNSKNILNDEGNSWGVKSADIDNDGDIDIFVANFDGNILWLNDGDGNFIEHSIPGIGGGPGIDIADLDSDGDLDLVTGYVGTNTLKYWLNDGSLNFSQHVIDSGADSSYGPVIIDIDNDGDLDIYAPSRQGGNTYPNRLFINDGSLNFSEEHIVGDINASLHANIIDIDNDGDLDIYTPSFGAIQNKLFINDGLGQGAQSFTSSDIIGDTLESYGSDVGDIDNDGDIDIFATNINTKNTLWLNDGMGNGGASFHAEQMNNVDTRDTLDVKIIDIDNDGDMDILATRDLIESVLWINNGEVNQPISSSFSETVLIGDSDSKISLTINDFDGDGYLDFYETAYGEQNKLWINSYRPSSTVRSSRRGSRIRYVCKNKLALNYSQFGRHKSSLCKFDLEKTKKTTKTTKNIFNNKLCSSDQLIHNLMKNGDTNGVYSSYNKGIITEVSLLQSHINRILADEYTLAAGPVDKWFRSKTQEGVKRLQRKLNSLNATLNLDIDGIVGPHTREAINHSC